MKIACVVHRYGSDIAGGSETHCRQIAERLAAHHDVTVLTSCARDYVTWANAYPAGHSDLNGVGLLRFPVDRPRDPHRFAELGARVFAGRSSAEDEEHWFRENGPSVPGLLDHLRDHGRTFDVVLFWSYRYYPTYFGLPLVAGRAVLVPTAEEDPAIDLGVLPGFFAKAAGYLFLTPEEEQLVSLRAGRSLTLSAVVGVGIEPAGPPASRSELSHLGLPPQFVLYLGRLDRNKGCHELFDHFLASVDKGGEATLVLAGPAAMAVPNHPRIRALGFVDDGTRDALLAEARVLVIPSPYESLSIVLLEGWNRRVPALVNGRCRPLLGQVRRANGGLWYRSSREFAEALSFLLSHPAEAAALGQQGQAYVEREYRWPTVMSRLDTVLHGIIRDGKS